jgi:phthiocerol/phenolphthiocerol synthesis type-I polyketide synthase E
MAARYIEALCAVQPNGPYLLGGSSFGGIVAFEMAQQLQARGQEIALLALIDTAAPEQLRVQLADNHEILAMASGALPDQPRQPDPDDRLRHYMEQARAAGSVPPSCELPEFRRVLPMLQAHLQAIRCYHPRPYPGSIVFFRAATRGGHNPPDPERGWIGLARGDFEVHEVPGDHITMNYAPRVVVMAEQLNQYLEQIADAAVY